MKRTASKQVDFALPFSLSSLTLSLLSAWLCGEPARLTKPGFAGFCRYSFLWNGQGSARVVQGERKDIWPQQHKGSSTAFTAALNHKEGSAILTAPRRNRTQVLPWPWGRNCCLHSSSPWERPSKDEEKQFLNFHRSQWLHCSKWPPAPEYWDCFSFASYIFFFWRTGIFPCNCVSSTFAGIFWST